LALSPEGRAGKVGATNTALEPGACHSDYNRPVAAIAHAISRRFTSIARPRHVISDCSILLPLRARTRALADTSGRVEAPTSLLETCRKDM
jgi:hypothetical protein